MGVVVVVVVAARHAQLKLTLAANIIASVAFLPVVVLTGQLWAAVHAPELADPLFWLFLLVTGVLGCLMAWVSAMQINVTSPVTHHISSNSKAVAQTIIAVLYYHETKRLLWWISVLMVVAGALSYAMVRMREERAGASSEPAQSDKPVPPSHAKPPEVTPPDDLTTDVSLPSPPATRLTVIAAASVYFRRIFSGGNTQKKITIPPSCCQIVSSKSFSRPGH